MARGPLTRTTARPAAPPAVAMAAMVSSSAIVDIGRWIPLLGQNEGAGPASEPGAGSALSAGLGVVSRTFRIVRGSDRQAFDHSVAQRVGLDARVVSQRHVHDAALLRVQ